MKIITTILVVGGLALAGTAAGQDPATQETGASGASMKMAIDPKTRKLRPLTPAESAALDAQTKASRMSAKGRAAKDGTGYYLPETQAEAEASRMERDGIDTMQPLADTMSALHVVQNPDGTLAYSENGVPVLIEKVQTRAVETARE